jgi:hypothetical protein
VPASPFRLLAREFFSRLFQTEIQVSDHQLRTAMIGVFAFLITPGLIIPLQFATAFRLAARRDPLLLDGLTRLFATTFLVYAMVTIGVIAVFEWDELVLDRRDAMILGPLPVGGRTVVMAKMLALAALLVMLGGAINGVTAVTFSLVAASRPGVLPLVRTVFAHALVAMAASSLVFFSVVTLRSALSMLDRGRIVVGSLLQFGIVSSLFCFLVFAPTTVHLNVPRHGGFEAATLHVQPVPPWLPTRWFVALYDIVRGAGDESDVRPAIVAVAATCVAALLALIAMSLSYRRQLRVALSPSGASTSNGGARWLRVSARRLSARDGATQALADFIVTTLARNRGPQATIALNAAIAVVMVAVDLALHRANIGERLVHGSPLPLIAVFWTAIGVRASFFVPAEWPASWIFSVQAVETSRIRFAAVRGAMTAILLPIALFASAALSITGPWQDAIIHVAIVAAATMLLVEVLALSIRFTPYTRPYEPGHAKLKTRWPLYLASSLTFVYMISTVERLCSGKPLPTIALFAVLVALSGGLERRGRTAHQVDADAEMRTAGDTVHLELGC